MNIDDLIIGIDSFDDFKDISDNMDAERINQYIREAQVLDLKAFLGPELYLLLIAAWDGTGFPVGPYQDLYEGKDYDGIRYYGLVPVLVYFTYARLLEGLNVNVTRAGVRVFNADESEPVEDAAILNKAASARSVALAYQTDASKYLATFKTIYPTWNDEAERKMGVRIFKV